ncbi:MAG: hypothetical protein II944_06200 [Ruminobacter sp.]|nr:hypothetical protein [Ruminobacter sp.]
MRITILISVFSWCCHSLTIRVTQKNGFNAGYRREWLIFLFMAECSFVTVVMDKML